MVDVFASCQSLQFRLCPEIHTELFRKHVVCILQAEVYAFCILLGFHRRTAVLEYA